MNGQTESEGGGEGERESRKIINFFHFSVPTSAQNVMASNNGTHIIIMWAGPATPNGRVNYTVKVEERDLLSGNISIVHTEVVTETELTVQYQVEPYSIYNISVTSQTSAGMAEAVTDSFMTPEKGSVFIPW